MLSDLQWQVAELITELPEAQGFALAGGAALIVRGDVVRQTRDLDFFGPEPDQVDALLPAVIRALTGIGLDVNVVREAHGFARLEVRSGFERTEVDLAADARILPLERGPVGPMLAAEELAVDKVLAVFGRAEARDFVDLAAVEGRYGLDRLCQLASDKDRGFDPGVLSQMMNRFDRLPRDEFELSDAAYERLAATVGRWREVALGLVLEREARDISDDTGLGL
ncbi:MAG: nucleotidyl transferase AbiEii/AbiGii toxin family protein [Acidimicrobiales bacterium]